MEPVEINAGNWYLLAREHEAWADDTAYSWSVCEATTADVQATLTLAPDGALSGTAIDGHTDALEAARAAVARFAEGGLGLTVRGE
ncbi:MULTISPECIES: hypothetical protein [unclassified Rhodococcus (in: high G+C Gram-positive bacteria)]|uniref:hypothetical protein n=1 Tax=Rhodococcus sp. SJ-3 TaxID=3454628 RepID=UPI003F79324C